MAKIQSIRALIAAGAYDTSEKLDEALDRMMDSIAQSHLSLR